MRWNTIKRWAQEGWKAIVALAVPILLGAAAEIIDGIGEWVTAEGFAWAGIAVGLLTSVSVWLKANRQQRSTMTQLRNRL